ncbi:transducin (beta)-like 1, partial [Phenoliferia sp. Uapishka_3]
DSLIPAPPPPPPPTPQSHPILAPILAASTTTSLPSPRPSPPPSSSSISTSNPAISLAIKAEELPNQLLPSHSPAPVLEEREEGEETESDAEMARKNRPVGDTKPEEGEEDEEGALKEEQPTDSRMVGLGLEVDVGVRKVTSEDLGVVKLRGHTMPVCLLLFPLHSLSFPSKKELKLNLNSDPQKVQPCSWNPKVPALLATGGGDSTCRIWDVPPPSSSTGAGAKEGVVVRENVVCKHSSAQRRADVAAVAWDPSGSLLATGSEDGIARIWTPSGDLHLVLSMHQRTIFSLKWNTLGTMLLTGSLDNTVCLWEVNSGKVKQQWSSHSDSVLDVDWNDDTTFASASMDKSIHLFNVQRVSPLNRFKGHRDEVNVVKFSPCGTLLASCSDDKSVRIWSLRNIPGFSLDRNKDVEEEGRLIDDKDHVGCFVLEGHEKDVHTLAWAPWVKGQKGGRLLAS